MQNTCGVLSIGASSIQYEILNAYSVVLSAAAAGHVSLTKRPPTDKPQTGTRHPPPQRFVLGFLTLQSSAQFDSHITDALDGYVHFRLRLK